VTAPTTHIAALVAVRRASQRLVEVAAAWDVGLASDIDLARAEREQAEALRALRSLGQALPEVSL